MDTSLKQTMVDKWNQYFPQSEMPIAVFYSDHLCGATYATSFHRGNMYLNK